MDSDVGRLRTWRDEVSVEEKLGPDGEVSGNSGFGCSSDRFWGHRVRAVEIVTGEHFKERIEAAQRVYIVLGKQ